MFLLKKKRVFFYSHTFFLNLISQIHPGTNHMEQFVRQRFHSCMKSYLSSEDTVTAARTARWLDLGSPWQQTQTQSSLNQSKSLKLLRKTVLLSEFHTFKIILIILRDVAAGETHRVHIFTKVWTKIYNLVWEVGGEGRPISWKVTRYSCTTRPPHPFLWFTELLINRWQ